ncbi:hypothetical protein QYE76_002135 [Lolium multiflorum]|uniref:Uncharacterized protein n=1 Tax=Lolium multiflorum TaxID=4521 RepID=A0AAD8RN11_LOLMU|nr:hypothetical protein QYE76_002135 [Lolium multiflorum]
MARGNAAGDASIHGSPPWPEHSHQARQRHSLARATITRVSLARRNRRAHHLPLDALGTTTPSTTRSAPRPPFTAIKGGLLHSIRAHQLLPHLTTALLATSIWLISHPSPQSQARSRRQYTEFAGAGGHPRTHRCYQGRSSSSTTTRRTPPTPPELRRALRPLLPPPVSPPLAVDRRSPTMEPVNTKFYQLGNGGSLIFEHDLNALSDHLDRPHPEFHGAQISDQPGGELQWIITADLRGKMEPPTSERILFSFMESNWLDGLARALQEGLARLCGMSGEALKHPRFSHLARRNSAGEPMDMQPHPELKHHVDHLDFMLYHTQQDLDNARSYANQTHLALTEHADAIKLLAKDRKTLRRQKAKKDATIARLRAKIASLEATVKAQEDQLNEMEEDGEDIQGGSDFLSDDNDFEDDENTEGEDYDFLDDGEDDHTPLDVDDDEEE